MGGVRTSFPIGAFTGGSRTGGSRPSGMVAGAPFEIFGPVGPDDSVARPNASAAALRRPQSLTAAVGSEGGLVFWLSGHCYRLRASDAEVPASSKDEPIPDPQILRLLDRAARQNAGDASLVALLTRAASEVREAKPDEPRFHLFETRPKLMVAPLILEPPPPPSKRAVEEKDLTFIEVEFVDEDGEPVPNVRYRLELPDSTVRKGTAGKNGLVSVARLEPGLCHLTLLGPEPPPAPKAQPTGDAAAAAKDSGPKEEPAQAGEEPAEVGEVALVDDSAADAELRVLEGVVTDSEGHPITNHRFEAHFSDGTVLEGVTDDDGRVHLQDCPSEECKLRFFEPA